MSIVRKCFIVIFVVDLIFIIGRLEVTLVDLFVCLPRIVVLLVIGLVGDFYRVRVWLVMRPHSTLSV